MNNRLTLDEENCLVGGVCSGLAKYTGTNPLLWRVIFSLLISTPAFWLYFILWAFLPKG